MPLGASAAVFTRSPFLACSQRSSPPYACARRLLRSRREPSKLSATSAARQTSCFCFEIGFDDGLDDLVDAGSPTNSQNPALKPGEPGRGTRWSRLRWAGTRYA